MLDRMSEAVWFSSVAQRWIRRRGASDPAGRHPSFPVDPDGFLDPSRAEADELVRPSDVVGAHRSWVLLGPPGSGKTTTISIELDRLKEEARERGEQLKIVQVAGSDLIDQADVDELLGAPLDQLPTASAPAQDEAELLVVIDGLDESKYLRQLPRWLRRKLGGRDTRTLRIWVACRPAEYPDQLTDTLADALGSCVVGDLAPLARQDAHDLIASAGLDASTVLAAVTDAPVGPLATTPLSLRVLLMAYRQGPGALRTASPLRLFNQAINASADERKPVSDGTFTTTTLQRVAIAARIAAYLMLTGGHAITRQTPGWLGEIAERAVPLDALAGGHETAGAGEFHVNKPEVIETLTTALFVPTGPENVAFAHSSFAAFLAARYLAEWIKGPGTTARTRQLQGLFLVSAPDDDTAAIPEHLRETAAWLLAHAPTEAAWLAEADPESLVGHTGIITDPRTRAVIVDGLLRRADRIELTDRSWQETPWQLGHPGLGDQLAPALTAGAEGPATEWATFTRATLAVRLARDSGRPELVEPLLRVAETPTWPIAIRQRAAKAAMTADSDTAVPRLRALLADLHPAPPVDAEGLVEASDADRPSELVGTLLSLLWPRHLTFAEAVPHIRPVSARWFLGMYLFQVRQFPEHVADDDIPELIKLAETTLEAQGVVLHWPKPEAGGTIVADGVFGTAAVMSVERVQVLVDFVAPIINRAMSSQGALEHLPRIARIATWFLYSSQRLPMPAAVDLLDQDDHEPATATELRRALAEELIAAGLDGRGDVSPHYLIALVVSRWAGTPRYGVDRDVPTGMHRAHRGSLLDSSDARWAAERADYHRGNGQGQLADTFDVLTAYLTPRDVPSDDSPGEPMWDGADALAEQQRTNLAAAVAGDSDAFWQLVRFLMVNLRTGRWEPVTSWDITRYPGAALWPEDQLREDMHTASRRYLEAEHDHHATWLGTSRGDWRALAGYVALATLFRHEPDSPEPRGAVGSLSELPVDRWAAWVGAIVEHGEYSGDTDQLARLLLEAAAENAPTELAQAVEQYVRTALVNSRTTLQLPDLPAQLAPLLVQLAAELRDALPEAVEDERVGDEAEAPAEPDDETATKHEIVTKGPIRLPAATATATAVAAWSSLVHQALRHHHRDAEQLALAALTGYGSPPAGPVPTDEASLTMAVAAARVLLAADAEQHWPAVHDAIASNDTLATAIATELTGDSYTTNTLLDTLNEEGLDRLYRWITSEFPPETHSYQVGISASTLEFRASDLRRHTINALARRGTPQAVFRLRRLVNDFPDRLDLHAALLDARRTAQANAVVHATTDQIRELLRDSSRRLVHSAAQLAEVIIETLDDIARGLPTHGHLLWDSERLPLPPDAPPGTKRKIAWRPKLEGSLAAYLAHELELRLGHRRTIVNREVVVRPTDAGDSGERPDILVETTTPSDGFAESPTISVPIEIKGAWHKEVSNAQEAQLAAHYVTDIDTSVGIYLVGWFPLEQWDAADDGRIDMARRHVSADDLRLQLELQAEAIRRPGRVTIPYVLLIARPTPRD